MKIKNKALVLYQNLTPLHMGTGSEIGFVDLPIQREKITGFPKGEASGIKGAFKSESAHPEWFGKERIEVNDSNEEVGSSYSIGSFGFTDARLLFLPVREYIDKLFVWVTCPFVLNRFRDEIKNMKIDDQCVMQTNRYAVQDDNIAYSLCGEKEVSKLELENFEFEVKTDSQYTFSVNSLISLIKQSDDMKLELIDKLQTSLYLISDTMFSYFCEMSTEVQTRIRIGENGVVDTGALFEEEYLPEYSILYNFVEQFKMAENDSADLKVMLNEPEGILQLGGGTSLGKGITTYWYHMDKEQVR